MASHDLQEPLRKVASFTQMLEQRYGDQLDDRAKQYIHFAVDGAKRMQLLINDLLDFSRVGRVTGGREAVATRPSLDSALDNLSARDRGRRGHVTARRAAQVLGNRAQLTQLFQNLIENAIKFRSRVAAARPHRRRAGRRHVGVQLLGQRDRDRAVSTPTGSS